MKSQRFPNPTHWPNLRNKNISWAYEHAEDQSAASLINTGCCEGEKGGNSEKISSWPLKSGIWTQVNRNLSNRVKCLLACWKSNASCFSRSPGIYCFLPGKAALVSTCFHEPQIKGISAFYDTQHGTFSNAFTFMTVLLTVLLSEQEISPLFLLECSFSRWVFQSLSSSIFTVIISCTIVWYDLVQSQMVPTF